MTSDTGIVRASKSLATTEMTMSRSVRMPIGTFPDSRSSTTMRLPTWRSCMSRAASLTAMPR